MRTTTLWLCRVLLLVAMLGPSLAWAQSETTFFSFRRRCVPEFDPSAAGMVAAIVAGGAAMVAKRKRG